MTRILSLALLLLSAAPLASLYAVVIGMDIKGSSVFYMAPSGEASAEVGSLAAVLQNPKASLEDLWTAIFKERWNPSTGQAMDAYFLSQIPALQAHHWTVVVPWILSLVLGVVFPFMLSVLSYLHGHHQGRGIGPSKRRRLFRIAKSIQHHRKTLEESDVNLDDLDDENQPRWRIPSPGKPRTFNGTRNVNSLCAICLNLYSVGDIVVWSDNEKCHHVYHEDCICMWLVRRRKQCPVCRQCFLLAGD